MNRKEETAAYNADYYEEHKEEIAVRTAVYRKEHRKELTLKARAFRASHKKEITRQRATHYVIHKKEIAVRDAAYRKTPKGKIVSQRRAHKRQRDLGFLPINEPFEGSNGHHVNREVVLYIPKELHTAFPHNVFTGVGMDEINHAAFKWLGERK